LHIGRLSGATVFEAATVNQVASFVRGKRINKGPPSQGSVGQIRISFWLLKRKKNKDSGILMTESWTKDLFTGVCIRVGNEKTKVDWSMHAIWATCRYEKEKE
jgi:hypothetical protein